MAKARAVTAPGSGWLGHPKAPRELAAELVRAGLGGRAKSQSARHALREASPPSPPNTQWSQALSAAAAGRDAGGAGTAAATGASSSSGGGGGSSSPPGFADAIVAQDTERVAQLMPELPARELPDLLALAVSCRQGEAAEQILSYVYCPQAAAVVPHQAQLQQALAEPKLRAFLLKQAAERKHGAVERWLLAAQGRAQPQLSAWDLAKSMRAAVQARDGKALAAQFARPEAAELDDQKVAFVVRAALEGGSAPGRKGPAAAQARERQRALLELLFGTAAVQGLGPRAIAGLLQTSLQVKNVPAVLLLAGLEGAHSINQAYLSFLLEAAQGLGDPAAVQCLSRLQGFQTELEQLVPAGSISGALRTAVAQGRRMMVFHMAASAHADLASLDPAGAAGILADAIEGGSGTIVRFLTWLAAVQALGPGHAAGLLGVALRRGDAQAVHYLCDELPGCRQLQADQLGELLEVAVAQPDPTAFCRLSQLPAAAELGGEAVARVLQAGLAPCSPAGASSSEGGTEPEAGEAAGEPCGSRGERSGDGLGVCAAVELLPGAQAIPAARVAGLMRGALQHCRWASLRFLCALPGAAALAQPQLGALLEAAPEQERRAALQALRALPAGRHLALAAQRRELVEAASARLAARRAQQQQDQQCLAVA